MSDTSTASTTAAAANPQRQQGQDKNGGTSSVTPERHDSRAIDDGANTPTRPASVRDGTGNQANTEGTSIRNTTSVAHNHTVLPSIDNTIAHPPLVHRNPHSRTNSGLHLDTSAATSRPNPVIYETPVQTIVNHSMTSPALQQPGMGSSLKSTLSNASMASSSLSPGSANSALPSPYLAAMTDLTPLPSPLVAGDSAAPWRRTRNGTPGSSRQGSLDDSTPTRMAQSLPTTPTTPSKRKKGYGSLVSAAVEASMASNAAAVASNDQTSSQHTRNRSISDFVPEPLQNLRQRHVTFGPGDETADYQMHREAYLATQRGLTQPSAQHDPSKAIPSPPPSNTSVAEESSDASEPDDAVTEDGDRAEYLQIHCGMHNRRRRFRQLRQLGQGTFSKVMLATSERIPPHSLPPDLERLDPHKMVAVKVVEHGPAGGADEERIGTSLKREVEMLKSISHPSLIHLKACEYQTSRSLLVLTYCPGGDLFELASQKRDILTPPLVRRMFAELVSAVRYLHTNWIVHRDIKLENVLVNLPPHRLVELDNPLAHSTSIITLTDLGLGRRIPEPPESPLLMTRCGSEDYAAPEILLGQPYDGRLTDAWALGVLLYALMEGRLPFDAPPGKLERSRNTHRIARCDWIWCRFGDEDGEWDASRAGAGEWEGARLCVEALLKKVRMGRKPLEEVAQFDWVKGAVQVDGGLRMRDEDLEDVA